MRMSFRASSFCIVHPILLWCYTDFFLEQPVEIGVVVIAEIEGDSLDLGGLRRQHDHCAFHLYMGDELVGRSAHLFLEYLDEMVLGKA